MYQLALGEPSLARFRRRPFATWCVVALMVFFRLDRLGSKKCVCVAVYIGLVVTGEVR